MHSGCHRLHLFFLPGAQLLFLKQIPFHAYRPLPQLKRHLTLSRSTVPAFSRAVLFHVEIWLIFSVYLINRCDRTRFNGSLNSVLLMHVITKVRCKSKVQRTNNYNSPSRHPKRRISPPPVHLPDSCHGVGHPVFVFPRGTPFPADHVVDLLLNFGLQGVGLVGKVEQMPLHWRSYRVRRCYEDAQDVAEQKSACGNGSELLMLVVRASKLKQRHRGTHAMQRVCWSWIERQKQK